ncbi:MAG: hypothetical protein ABFD75_12190 [Smithella sp.]
MRGGYRPGAGRKTGSKDKKPRKTSTEADEKKKLRDMLAFDKKAKARFYQEFLVRVSKGEKLTLAEKRMMDKIGAELSADLEAEKKPDAAPGDLEACDYLRTVWNDPQVDTALRIKAAEIVVRGDGDKKSKKGEAADRAKNAAAGKFAPSRPPLSVVK